MARWIQEMPSRLFLDRAGPLMASGALDEPTRRTVVRICERLDGLPLAIELAAAQLHTMSLSQIDSRLDQRLALRSRRVRKGSERQRTLRDVVAWSHDLLSATEQTVFRRLAGFGDGMTLDAAESVAGFGAITHDAVADALGALVEKSLVVARPRGPTIDTSSSRRSGRSASSAWSRRARNGRFGPECSRGHGRFADRLQDEYLTVRHELGWMLALAEANNLRSVYLSVRDDEVPAATTHRDLSLRLAMFTPIMELGDRIAAVERSLGDGGQPDELRATALLVLAELYFNSGGGQAGVDAGKAAAELFEGLGDRRLQTWARYAVAINLWGHVEDAEVLALAPPVIEEFRAQREPTGLAYALWIGIAARSGSITG